MRYFHDKLASLQPVLIGIILLFILSCSNNELTRSKAHSLIVDAQEFQRTVDAIRLSDRGFSRGKNENMWIQGRRDAALTPYGSQFFAGITSARASLKVAVKISLSEITGITDAPIGQGIKEVQFLWKYDDLPVIPKRYVVGGGTGKAHFRRYDDGWRIEELDLRETDLAATLNPAEQQEGDDIVRTIAAKIQEAEKKRQEAEQARINAIINRFRSNGDGTVTDRKTNLTWLQRPVTDRKWHELKAECKAITVGGRMGWHMATRAELETLIGNGNAIIDAPDGRYFQKTINTGRGPFRVADSIDRDYCWSWKPGTGYKTGWQRNGKWFIDARALCVTKR